MLRGSTSAKAGINTNVRADCVYTCLITQKRGPFNCRPNGPRGICYQNLTEGRSLFGGNSGGGQQQTTITISAVVQELNQEYDARLDEIRANASYDEESLIGSRAPWSEILAVYAVKTASDLTNGQEVVTMTDGKKVILEQVFWDMNELSSFTSTVPGEGDDGSDTTTLYITVTAKTADEMADIYGFNDDQRHQLAELLSDEYREMWSDAL